METLLDTTFTSSSSLSYEEECKYSNLIHFGDEYDREKAMDILAGENQRLLKHLVSKSPYYNRGVDFEDLMGWANIGLSEAIMRFDPTKGARLSTYIAFWVRHELETGFGEQSKLVRIPESVRDTASSILFEIERWTAEYGYEPTDYDLASSGTLGLSESEISEIRSYFYATASLDGQISDDSDDSMLEIVADETDESPVAYCNRHETLDCLREAIDQLPERERFVILHSDGLFGCEKLKKGDIAKHLGVSSGRLTQIIGEAVKHLQEIMTK